MPQIQATEKNVDWLIARLSLERQFIVEDGIRNPVFVLLTQSIEDRRLVERKFFEWAANKYGMKSTALCRYYEETKQSSRIRFRTIVGGVEILLMDVT